MGLIFSNAEKHSQDTIVFSNLNISIDAGQVISIYTNVNIRETLVDILTGDTKLSHGDFTLQSDIGFLLLQDGLYERLKVNEMLTFMKRLYDSNHRLEDVTHLMQLESIKNKKIHQLSFSECKRVQMACLLMQDPDVYVMEEPDQNLDLESKRVYVSFLHHLRKEKKAVLVITGSMESALEATDVAYTLDGEGLRRIEVGSEDEQQTHDDTKEMDRLPSFKMEKIPSKVNEKIVLFHPLEIDYIESQGGQSFLHVKDEAFPCTFTLQQLEQRLFPFGFFRCHRSYLVNLQKVREVMTWTRNSYSLILENKDKTTIPLSKTKMAELKALIGI